MALMVSMKWQISPGMGGKFGPEYSENHLPFPQELIDTVEVREGTAPIDVGDQKASGIGLERGTHVHKVAVMRIDLGWRASAFDRDHIVFR